MRDDIADKNTYQALYDLYSLPTNWHGFSELDPAKQEYYTREYGLQKVGYGLKLSQQKKLVVAKLCLSARSSESWEKAAEISGQLMSDGQFSRDMAGQIMRDVQQHFAEDQVSTTHKLRIIKFIKKVYDLDIREEDISVNGEHGKNSGYVTEIGGKRYFIKTCGGKSILGLGNDDGKIHPNELFLYKALEYMNYGPRVQFLIQPYSSLGNSTRVAHGNYVMTEAVPNFLMDTPSNKEAFDEFKSPGNRQNAVEISCASLVRDLLSLGDTFPANCNNYGISRQSDGSIKFMFVDHLPTVNGYFAGNVDDLRLKNYSPRENMQSLCRNMTDGNFKDLSQSYSKWQKFELSQDVNRRIFHDGHGHLSIENALNAAREDVKRLIAEYGANFTEKEVEVYEKNPDGTMNPTGRMVVVDAGKILDSYYGSILEKVKNYKKTTYSVWAQGGVNV